MTKLKFFVFYLSIILTSSLYEVVSEEIEVDHDEDDRFDGINFHDALSRNPAVQNFTVNL